MKHSIQVEPDLPETRPRYRPGDIVPTKAGEIGVIVEAKVIGRNWNGENFKGLSGNSASHAVDFIPGFPRPKKFAWWSAEEWDRIILGPLHATMESAPLAQILRVG